MRINLSQPNMVTELWQEECQDATDQHVPNVTLLNGQTDYKHDHMQGFLELLFLVQFDVYLGDFPWLETTEIAG